MIGLLTQILITRKKPYNYYIGCDVVMSIFRDGMVWYGKHRSLASFRTNHDIELNLCCSKHRQVSENLVVHDIEFHMCHLGSIYETEWSTNVCFETLVEYISVLQICVYWHNLCLPTGLLLREIKEFWRPALMLSLLLYPEDIFSFINLSDKDKELNHRRGLFNRVENAILEMGTNLKIPHFLLTG